MVDKASILYEYEDILMGKRKEFRVSFTDTLDHDRKAVGIIWRYAIENLLGWTPEQAITYLNKELIKALKLDKTYCKIGFEYNTKKYMDWRYILQYAFPESVYYSTEDDARREYERVNKFGEFENDTEEYKFHKNYFSGSEGITRASVVLTCAISTELASLGMYELYRFFGNRKMATDFLKRHNIEVNVKSLYKSPLEYYHNSLPDAEVNNVYYVNEWLRTKYF